MLVGFASGVTGVLLFVLCSFAIVISIAWACGRWPDNILGIITGSFVLIVEATMFVTAFPVFVVFTVMLLLVFMAIVAGHLGYQAKLSAEKASRGKIMQKRPHQEVDYGISPIIIALVVIVVVVVSVALTTPRSKPALAQNELVEWHELKRPFVCDSVVSVSNYSSTTVIACKNGRVFWEIGGGQ